MRCASWGRPCAALIVAATVLYAVLVARGSRTSADQEPLPVDFVAAGMEHGFEAVRQAVATVVCTLTVPAGATGDGGPTPGVRTEVFDWVLKAPSFYLSRDENSPLVHEGTALEREVVWLQNGDYCQWRRYRYPGKGDGPGAIGCLGVRAPAEAFTIHGLPSQHLGKDPRTAAYFQGEVFVPDFLRDPSTKVRSAGRERLFGADCSCIEAAVGETSRLLLWVDVEHGFIIRRREMHVRRGEQDSVEQEQSIPEVVGEGSAWLPQRVVGRRIVRGKDGQPAGEITSSMELRDVAFTSAIPESLFDLSFPQGTVVSDRLTNRVYEVSWVPADEEGAKGEAGIPEGDPAPQGPEQANTTETP